jgi:hypothetical protein
MPVGRGAARLTGRRGSAGAAGWTPPGLTHSCHRSGHHLDPRPGVRCRSRRRGAGARGIPAAFPGFGLGRTRPRGSVAQHPGDGPGRTRPIRAGTGPDRGHRHHQPARDVVVWERDTGGRSTTPSSGRTGARPPFAATCARLATKRRSPRGPACCSIPYFSGTKLRLAARQCRRRAGEGGEWRSRLRHHRQLSDLAADRRPAHVTDATNAARTLLYNIHRGAWDEILRPSGHPDGDAARGAGLRGGFRHGRAGAFRRALPICGVAGDQQAATVGQACFAPGMLKSTYGTGCFALLNTGAEPVASRNRLLTTIAYRFDGVPTYALEGSIFIAGAVVQWLRDGLGIIETAAQTQGLAEASDPRQQLYRGAGLHRPRRALLGCRMPRRDVRPDAQFRARRIREGGAGKRRLPDPRPARGDAGRYGRPGRGGAARRWRHDGIGLDDAIPRRHSRRAGRPAQGAGNDGAGRGLAGRDAGRHLSGARGICAELVARSAVPVAAARSAAGPDR